MDVQVVATTIGHDYELSKLYKITIHMICTISKKQQLVAIYYLVILHWYCTLCWNILGTLWVWLC